MRPRECETWGGHAEMYLTDDLTARQRWLYEEHLATCRACRAEMAGFEDLYRRLHDLPMHDPPRDFARVILEDVCPEPDAFAWVPHRHVIRRVAAGAFALAAAGAFVLAGRELFGRISALTMEVSRPAAVLLGRFALGLARGFIDTVHLVDFLGRIGGKFVPLLEALEVIVRQVHVGYLAGGLVLTGLAAYLLARLLGRALKGGAPHVPSLG